MSNSDVPPPGLILSRFPPVYEPRQVTDWGPCGGFSGAVILRISTEIGEFCLRGWPPKALPRPRIFGLHRLLSEVFRRGVTQVAVPVRSQDGTTLVRAGHRDWQLEPWMPGRADFVESPTDSRLRASMVCLARWHQAACLFEPSHEEARWFRAAAEGVSPAVLERSEQIEGWLAGRLGTLREVLMAERRSDLGDVAHQLIELFAQAAPSVLAELQAAPSLPVPLQPCLRDVWHDHLLFTNDEVTGLIDPSACRTENVTADLSRLLGSLVGDWTDRWTTALDAYQQIRPLSWNELSLLRTLDRSGVLLSGMTWLDRWYLKGPMSAAILDRIGQDRIVNRLRGILIRLKHLADSL